MEQKKNRPVHETRVGLVRCAVWSNKTKDGRDRLSVTVSRLYPVLAENGSKDWRTTESFGDLDIPLLQKALDGAFEYMRAEAAKVAKEPEPAEDEADRVASIG